MANIGDRIAKQYMLEKELEKDEYSAFFLGRNLNDDRPIMIRMIKPGDAGMRETFLKSLLKLENLKHPNLQLPLESGETPHGEIFVVTRMEGIALNELIPQNEGLDLTQIWAFVSGIGAGLSAAHKRGVFHFDLNPMHIRVETDKDGNETTRILWLGQGTLDTDLANFRTLVAFMLAGKKPSAQAVASVVPEQHFVSAQGFVDRLSELHRKQITLARGPKIDAPPENVVDFSVGRFLVASIIVTLIGCTMLLYFWLTSST